MVNTQVNIIGPLSFSIVFTKQASEPQSSQEAKLSQDFFWDFTEENIDGIFGKMVAIDGVVARKFDRDGIFKWEVNLESYPHVSNRFRCLIPRLCKSRHLDSALYPFQKLGKIWLLQSTARILADDMGLGKSIQSIAAIEEGIFLRKFEKVLVVCPNTLLSNWEGEFRKWCPLLTYSCHTTMNAGDKIHIRNKISNSNVLIATYSSISKLALALLDDSYSFDLIVADEAHKLRKSSSKLNRAFRSIDRKRTWLLTGTPLERDEEDIKNILVCLEPHSASALDKRGDNVIFKSRLLDVSLRRLKSDVLSDLPAVHRVIENLEMSPSQLSDYRLVQKQMQQAPPVERIGFLVQLSYAAIVARDGSSNKFDRAVEVCEVAKEANKKVIVFSYFNDALRLFRKRLAHHKIGSCILTGEVEKVARERNISKFRSDSEITCLLCNSKIGSEGLTLTEASIVVFLNEWWNPSSNRQAEDRVNRIGQIENVVIYILRSINTIDENLSVILNNKVGLEKEFMDKLADDVLRQTY